MPYMTQTFIIILKSKINALELNLITTQQNKRRTYGEDPRIEVTTSQIAG